jgi:PKD repeat protein
MISASGHAHKMHRNQTQRSRCHKFKFCFFCMLALAASGLLSVALGFPADSKPELPNLDKRMRTAQFDDAQQASVKQLKARLAGAQVEVDEVAGSPKFVRALDRFLTGPAGEGGAVRAEQLRAIPVGDPHRAVKGFLNEYAGLFGHGAEALNQAHIERTYVTPHNGLRTVIWEQQVDEIAVYQGRLIAHTTSKGELVSIASRFVANPDAAATRGTKDRTALVAAPTVSAPQAVALAAQNLGEDVNANQVTTLAEAEVGPEKHQKFKAPELKGETDVRLTWLPMDKVTLRLCWDVVLMSRKRGEMFRVVLDARSGEVLVRTCLTQSLADASYRVFTSDSPSPFSPGWPTPNTNQPPLVSRTLITLSAMDTNASPAGWINDGDNQTLGNNVDAHTDRNSDNVPDLPRPQGSPFRVFDFPMDLTAQDPTNYAAAAVAQLFYLCNRYHDTLYQLGFTEAAGNFQSNNFSRGGVANDAVQADAQDGSGTDNANFSTPPDGSPGRMQMYIFTAMSPRRDGDLDAEIVFHEHTHGLSWRLVGGGQALGTTQSDGMGEGWSDFYGLSLLSEPGDDVNGVYAAGAYASYKIGGVSDTQNYYFGIRRYPYSTDMTKNPLTFKDIDPAQADFCSSSAPYHTGMFGTCSAASASEVHNEGEVWCVTLWDARANLINKYGWAVGNQLILQLATDGMKLTPAAPNFLQARDAIIQADLVDTGGANRNELWAAFAKRGMGFSATSPGSSTTTGLVEAYDLPDDLRVTPQTSLTSSGPVGGPFNPASQTYTLSNTGSNALTWAAQKTAAWLDLSAAGGSLASGDSNTVSASVNGSANTFPMGIYTDSIVFSNITSGVRQTRAVMLRVGQPDYFTELFDTTPNDTDNQSLMFTPDGSASYYAACRNSASAFPTDPAGGTTLALTDDNYVQVSLTGGAQVSLYGTSYSSFFVDSNGYITFGSGDTSMTASLSTHFSRPRIAALFDDLNPGAGGSVSWKQLADRVAVTYQNVPQYGTSNANSFQIEMFFNGQIRVTWLAIADTRGLAGLSRGTGVPTGFVASDLSTYAPCQPLSLVSSIVSSNSGNGNASLDPNECNDVFFLLHNEGTAVVSSVSVTLSTSTPGLTIVQPFSTYPDVLPGQTVTNLMPFTVNSAPSFVCGSTANVLLNVAYSGGSQTATVNLPSNMGNSYTITQSTGASIVPGTTDSGNHCDDCVTTIALPFNYTFYGTVCSSVTVSSDGNLQFGGSNTAWANTCLPVSGWAPAIFAHWDDLRTDASGSGIFTSTSGTAPNRVFNIEWRATYYSGGTNLNFEVRLYESQPRFDLIYGTLNGTGSSATVGVENNSSAYTQFECNTAGLSSGLQLAFDLMNCPDGGGGCGALVANFHGTPTTGLAPLTVTFTDTSSGAITNRFWDFGDSNTTNVTTNVVVHSYGGGMYGVTLIVSGPDGSATNTRPNYITALTWLGISCPAEVSTTTDVGACTASGVALGNPSTTGTCPGSVTIINNAPAQLPTGTNQVVWTATDGCGNSSTCTQQVVVVSTRPPTISCPNIVTNVTPNCAAALTYTPTATGNCGATLRSVTCKPVSGSSFKTGVTPVTCTAIDTLARTNTCSFTVTVLNTASGVLTYSVSPTNYTYQTCGPIAVTFRPLAKVSDLCLATDTRVIVTNYCVPPSRSIFPMGTTTVHCYAQDKSGNTATCSFDITLADLTKPTIKPGVKNECVVQGCDATVSYTGPVNADKCIVVTVDCTPASGTADFTIANARTTSNLVTCTATDAGANSASTNWWILVNQRVTPQWMAPVSGNGLCFISDTDAEPTNTFAVGQIVTNQVKLFDLNDDEVTAGMSNAVVKIQFSLRNQDTPTSSSLITNVTPLVPRLGRGTKGTNLRPVGTMKYITNGNYFAFDVITTNWVANTVSNFYRATVTVTPKPSCTKSTVGTGAVRLVGGEQQ